MQTHTVHTQHYFSPVRCIIGTRQFALIPVHVPVLQPRIFSRWAVDVEVGEERLEVVDGGGAGHGQDGTLCRCVC